MSVFSKGKIKDKFCWLHKDCNVYDALQSQFMKKKNKGLCTTREHPT